RATARSPASRSSPCSACSGSAFTDMASAYADDPVPSTYADAPASVPRTARPRDRGGRERSRAGRTARRFGPTVVPPGIDSARNGPHSGGRAAHPRIPRTASARLVRRRGVTPPERASLTGAGTAGACQGGRAVTGRPLIAAYLVRTTFSAPVSWALANVSYAASISASAKR